MGATSLGSSPQASALPCRDATTTLDAKQRTTRRLAAMRLSHVVLKARGNGRVPRAGGSGHPIAMATERRLIGSPQTTHWSGGKVRW